MPTYVFGHKDGTRVERVYSMAKVPRSIRVKGKRLQRLITPGHIDTFRMNAGYPYVSNAQARFLPGCKTDSIGRPIIESIRHEREVCARNNLVRD